MQINHPKAYRQYRRHHQLATLREYKYEKGKRIRITANGKLTPKNSAIQMLVELARKTPDAQDKRTLMEAVRQINIPTLKGGVLKEIKTKKM